MLNDMGNDSQLNNEQQSDTNHVINNSGFLAQTKQWQRLSPIAIVFFAFGFIKALAGQVIFIAPTSIIGYKQLTENPGIWLPIITAILLLLIVSALLQFYYFQYRLSKNTIEIRAGVFKKSHTNLPFSRIQNVKLEQPIYYRLTGYACLQLDTAGSNKQEVKVAALPLAFAEALKKEILAQHSQTSLNELENKLGNTPDNINAASSLNTPSAQEVLLNTRALKDLVIHGITSNRIWIFLGASAPFIDNIYEFISDKLLSFGFDISSSFDLATHSWLEVGVFALSLTLLVMLILTSFSVLGSVMTFYGYTLSKVGDKYIRRSGLLTKHEVTMRLSRLQMIVKKQDWLDMILKRINLKFEQSNAQVRQSNAQAINNKIMVPSITPAQSQQLIDEVYPENQLANIDFITISKHFLVKNLVYILLPILALCQTVLLFNAQYELAISILIPFSFIAFLIVMRWLRWGYANDESFIYLRKGYIGVDYYCFPVYKVQQTAFKQSIMMKRNKLATVKLVLASGSMSIPYIDQSSAYRLLNETLYQVESSDKSWM
jgi:putative membrane protein